MNTTSKCYIHKTLEFSTTLFILLMMTTTLLHAQIHDFDADFYYQKSLSVQKSGMIVLGSWAGLNILSGSAGYFLSDGTPRYFHQMNAAWNVVNLGIATFGYLGATAVSEGIAVPEMISEMTKFDRILLINAGLDLAYIGVGAWLWNKGLNDQKERITGYGKSIVLQGGFLLLFDSILYLLHSPYTQDLIRLSDDLTLTATGFRYTF